MAELVFFRRAEELMRVNLDGRRLTIGRAPANDILVPDPTVSRQQFSVEKTGEGFVLKDLSGRGTDVGGALKNEVSLEDGVDIGLGQWRAVFNASGSGDFGTDTTEQRGDTVIEQQAETDARVVPARLRIRHGGKEKVLPFEGEVTVGSSGKGVLVVEDEFVSANHLRIQRRGNSFHVRDLASKNGTFLGAVRLYEAELPFGCALKVGSAELTLLRGDRELETTNFEGMVGADPAMKKLYETIERVAPSPAAIAVFGESGTGKELVARAIHQRSHRADREFVPVNCGAISAELVESELFGHEKGAFTGADKLRRGAFEEADGGTLFLDEIGELPLELQAKLLRALELGEIKRVGSSRPLNVDVRVIAATNRDLRAEVKKGRFREDLYWRLCVIPVQLPPLRARKGDVKALVHHFLKVFSPQGTTVALGPDAEKKLLEHEWPGNVRELKNAIHRSLLLRRGPSISAADITFDQELEFATKASEPAAPSYDPDEDDSKRIYIVDKTLEAIDDEVFAKTVKRLGASPSVVARALGLSRGAVYRAMKKLGIAPGGGDKDDKGASEDE